MFIYLIKVTNKAPVGAVILRHLRRSVRVTESDGIYISTTDIRVKVRTHHHKVN